MKEDSVPRDMEGNYCMRCKNSVCAVEGDLKLLDIHKSK